MTTTNATENTPTISSLTSERNAALLELGQTTAKLVTVTAERYRARRLAMIFGKAAMAIDAAVKNDALSPVALRLLVAVIVDSARGRGKDLLHADQGALKKEQW